MNALRDGAHGVAKGTSGAVLSDEGKMSLSVKGYGLVAGVRTSHVAFTTVDTHIIIHDGDNLEELRIINYMLKA